MMDEEKRECEVSGVATLDGATTYEFAALDDRV